MSWVLSRQTLEQLVDAWIAEGRTVGGPRRVKPDCVLYEPLTAAAELVLDPVHRPRNSIKAFVFPRHEKLYGYRLVDKRIELHDVPAPDVPQIIIAARPCDAAALPILDHVFNWDCEDEFYTRRRRATTVITLACTEPDPQCFCTSLGLSPDDERGSDAMLFDLGDGHYDVRCLTDRGRSLLAGHAIPSNRRAEPLVGPAPSVNLEAVNAFLDGGFDRAEWPMLAIRCLGCGACTYSCPTCHCFDIAEVGNAAGGARVKNWDACQFAMFTKHASGHNPRNTQAQRQRQRIYHKFQVYPERFGEVLCTGCGNCTRNCPVGLGVRGVLEAIQTIPVEQPSEASYAEHLQA